MNQSGNRLTKGRVAVAVLLLLTILSCRGEIETAPGVGREEYLKIFNDVTARIFNDRSRMLQIATVIASLPVNREVYADTTRRILTDLELQRRRLEEIEPIPMELEDGHSLMKTAIDQFILSASLFLPADDETDPKQFDRSSFSELMSSGGASFLRATELVGAVD